MSYDLVKSNAGGQIKPADVFEKESISAMMKKGAQYIAENFKTAAARQVAIEELAATLEFLRYDRQEAALRRMVEETIGQEPALHGEICQYRPISYQGNPGRGLSSRSRRISPQDNFPG